MRKTFLIMLFAILTIPTRLFAYTDGQVVHFEGNHYSVISAAQNTLRFLGCDDSKAGVLNIPVTVFDKKDTHFKVKEIGFTEGYGCTNITEIVVPEGVSVMKWASFGTARKLKVVKIPASVASIETGVYVRCGACRTEVNPNNQNFCNDEQGSLFSKNKDVLYSVGPIDGVETYTVPAEVKKIEAAAIRHLKGLKKIILPPNLQTIYQGWPTISPYNNKLEEFAIADGGTTPFKVIEGVLFKDHELVAYPRNKSTQAYQVPPNITSIAPYGIHEVEKMTSIDLNEVTQLKGSALASCIGLQEITIPKDLEANASMEGAIEFCYNIKSYKVADGCVNFAVREGVLFSKDMTKLYLYPPSKPEETYQIPVEVTEIKAKAFMGAQKLQEMTVPSKVTALGQWCFRGMKELRRVTFEEESNVRKFGEVIFWGCNKLEEITLPKSLEELKMTFYLCNSLRKINVPSGSQLKNIGYNCFVQTPNLEEFNIPNDCPLQTIDGNAFANCTKLKTFNFPKSVTAIDQNAFSGCNSMSQVTFAPDADIVAFGAGSFADCGLTSIDIPKRVSSIDREAFRNCKVLTEVNVPAITTHVSPEAFKFCDKLTDIRVDKGNTQYSSLDGILLTKDKQTLVLFPPGKANDKFTLLPPSITTIGEYSFYECLALKNVTIPNKVTKIGKRAFGLCKNLHTVTFLCDRMIKPEDIVQGQNDMAFDDGSQAPKMFDNIDIHVRKSLLDQYKGETFYKQFKSISPSFIDGDGEYIPVSPTDADLLSTTTTDYTYVVPTTAKNGATSYAVSLVGDYLFQGKANDKVKEVVVKDNVKYIGARAFVNDLATSASTVEHVFFIGTTPTGDMLSTVRFELDETGTNYNEFSPQAKVFVKKSAEAGYKAAWAKYANQIDYKIPDVKIAKKYGTFAREFDADFSEYYKEKNGAEVAAFVAGSSILPGGGDYGTSTYHVRMRSIDVKGGVNGNYGYVPAYTGVLLKVLDKESTPDDFYYTIGEQDNRTYNVSDNIMHGITVRNERVEASATEPVYVMQGGVFRKATADIGSFSVHKAYMKPGTLPAGAKVMLVFDDAEGAATGIETVAETGSRKEDNVYYNLNGQRVDNPRHGVYIRNGKKVIIK